MPSDTVWVALISGGVTVSALGVQGWLNRSAENRRTEREDRHRVEDRTARIREQNLADRRKLYARLLASAAALLDAAWWQLVNVEREEGRKSDDKAMAALKDYGAATTAAELEAVDRAVLRVANELGDAAGGPVSGIFLMGIEDEEEREKYATTLRRVKNELLPALRDTCRRDLGFDQERPSEG
jgi:hypothetical protein